MNEESNESLKGKSIAEIIDIADPTQFKLHVARKNFQPGEYRNFWNMNSKIQPLDDYMVSQEKWDNWNRWAKGKNDFNKDYIFAVMNFYPDGKNIWLFGGIYRVLSHSPEEREDGGQSTVYYYQTKRQQEYSDYEGRLKIKFEYTKGKPVLRLEKYIDKMTVSEILPESLLGKKVLPSAGGESKSHKNPSSDIERTTEKARSFVGSGGESKAHKRLKEYVQKNPSVVGLFENLSGETEYPLPSGDKIDVYFEDGDVPTAVEVKSAKSNEGDIARGIFQCVKYKAVLEAEQLAKKRQPNARAIFGDRREIVVFTGRD